MSMMSTTNKRSKGANNGANGRTVQPSAHTGIVVYHEKQIKELCALHALNNLFQQAGAFTKHQLDEICHNLSPNVWINPHKSLLGLGNYDINVIMKALQLYHNYGTVWFDKRKDPTCLNLDNIFGFILNVPTDYRFGFVLLPLKRRHWIAIRQINGFYYNLDSKLDSPLFIGQNAELISYLKEQLECCDKELFIVVTHSVERAQAWQLPSSTTLAVAGTHRGDRSELELELDDEHHLVQHQVSARDTTSFNEEQEHSNVYCVTMNPLCVDNTDSTDSTDSTDRTDRTEIRTRTFKHL